MGIVISTADNSSSIEIIQNRQQNRQRTNKKPSQSLILQGFCVVGCREEGIRTLETLLAFTHFPGVLLRPLGHLSKRGQR